MKSTNPSSHDQRIQSALAQRRNFTKGTIATLMRAREMLLLAVASAIIKLREEAGPVKQLLSLVKERDLRIHELEERAALLETRMARIESKHRTRYTPEERYNILVKHYQAMSLN